MDEKRKNAVEKFKPLRNHLDKKMQEKVDECTTPQQVLDEIERTKDIKFKLSGHQIKIKALRECVDKVESFYVAHEQDKENSEVLKSFYDEIGLKNEYSDYFNPYLVKHDDLEFLQILAPVEDYPVMPSNRLVDDLGDVLYQDEKYVGEIMYSMSVKLKKLLNKYHEMGYKYEGTYSP